MKLFTREWGTGPRTAVLVHGIMSDSRTWHRVAPRLATHGYRVLAVDLRGHGHSPRGAYNPHAWANDLVEKLPEHPELAIGHSLGAVALALAADRLRATRTVYSDPAWLTATADPVLDLSRLLDFKDATREQIAAMNPRWDARDVEVEAATLQLWDPATIDGARLIGVSHAEPDRPSASALVQLAFESLPFSPPPGGTEDRLRERGLEVRVVPRVGHCIHRDDLDAFFVGTTEEVESEGVDRADLTLPGRQDELVHRVAEANPNTVVVVNSGAPVLMPWRESVAAVLLTWFPGQEAGRALADVLLGRTEPGGRLHGRRLAAAGGRVRRRGRAQCRRPPPVGGARHPLPRLTGPFSSRRSVTPSVSSEDQTCHSRTPTC